MRGIGLALRRAPAAALAAAPALMLAMTGSARVSLYPAPQWLPGGVGDDPTSLGGDLRGTHGHSTAPNRTASDATASRGSVSEPCNDPQTFPHPPVPLATLLQGATTVEADCKRVAWPQQSLFIG